MTLQKVLALAFCVHCGIDDRHSFSRRVLGRRVADAPQTASFKCVGAPRNLASEVNHSPRLQNGRRNSN